MQKYGGTSVGKQLGTIAQQIAPAYLQRPNTRLAIVCSARSGQTKALGTTNLLLQAAKEALLPEDDADYASPTEPNSLSNSVSSLRNLQQSGSTTGANASAPTQSRPHSSFSRLSRSASRGAGLSASPLSSSSRRNDSPALQVAASSSSNGGGALDAKLSALSTEEGVESSRSGKTDSVTAIGYHATVDRILADHLASVRQAVTRNSAAREQLERDIVDDCERLRDFLMAAKIIEEISPRSKDIIMSIGERLSCRIVVGALLDNDIEAELVGMETIIDAAFLEELHNGRARHDSGFNTAREDDYLDQHFYDLLAIKMAERLRSANGVPVITGKYTEEQWR